MLAAPARSEPESVRTFNCYGTGNMATCSATLRSGGFDPHVIAVPAPQSREERDAAEARDRRWAERCRPTIRQDRYGMPRYRYAATGCEFGHLD